MSLRQKDRGKWAIDGDENSTYFHMIINKNRRNNKIHGLGIKWWVLVKPKNLHLVAFNLFKSRLTKEMYQDQGYLVVNQRTFHADGDVVNWNLLDRTGSLLYFYQQIILKNIHLLTRIQTNYSSPWYLNFKDSLSLNEYQTINLINWLCFKDHYTETLKVVLDTLIIKSQTAI